MNENKLWLAHREAAFAHYGAVSYRAAMCLWMPPAATAASDSFLAGLAAEKEKTYAAWVAAWNEAYPASPAGGFDVEAYEAQQRGLGQLQTTTV